MTSRQPVKNLNKELKTEINTTFKELYTALALFKKDEINVVPFEGSWTAGQVTEHIIKAISGLPRLCNNNTEKSFRQPDEKINDIKKNIFRFYDKDGIS